MTTYHKYQLYEASVQDPKKDVRLFSRFFKDITGRTALSYREDFCGTFIHSVEWVKLSNQHLAWALDKSKEPLNFGKKYHYENLKEQQKKNITICHQDVLKGISRKVDLITATNFSYFIFKKRETMKLYFKAVYDGLTKRGLFLLDILGGTEMQGKSLDRHTIRDVKTIPAFDYFWEQKFFDPISYESTFAIHFRPPGRKRLIRNAFTYDWRLWTIAEIKELLAEVGFSDIRIYWEGSTRKGEGNGIFTLKRSAENSEVWIAYIAALRAK